MFHPEGKFFKHVFGVLIHLGTNGVCFITVGITMFECFIVAQHNDGYRARQRLSKATPDAFVAWYEALSTVTPHFIGIATTVIARRPWSFWEPRKKSRETVFLAVDCDSDASAIVAAHCLCMEGIHYVQVESSPGKSWLITDYVGTHSEVQQVLSRTVGADKKFVQKSADTGINIRATVRLDAVPSFDIGLANRLRDERVRHWLQCYHDLINKQDKILRNLKLTEALRLGTVYDLAADPDFLV